MKNSGEIIIIEDDQDDREFLDIVFADVLEEYQYTNKLVFLKDGAEALEYLSKTNNNPFMIISDINMPKMDGFQLRDRIFKDDILNEKCIPYIFLTTSGSNPEQLKKAYKLSIQGFFTKPLNFDDYKTLVHEILNYWKRSLTPTAV